MFYTLFNRLSDGLSCLYLIIVLTFVVCRPVVFRLTQSEAEPEAEGEAEPLVEPFVDMESIL